MPTETQLPDRFRAVIDEQVKIYSQGRSIQAVNQIPGTDQIPIQDPKHWLKIPNVICVFVDMKGSTKLSASTQDKKAAGAYQLFTGTAVRLMDAFEAPYIDVRGDGVFALFNETQTYRALAAAVTFKTFAQEVFVPKMKADTGLEVGGHFGIDMKTVLVRKVGLKRHGDRTDRQNEVWAGKPVNMASKLAASADSNQLWVSDRFFARIDNVLARKSCGCGNPQGQKTELWTEHDLGGDAKYDFSKAYVLKSNWCATHGRDFCEAVLKLDE